jgi:hypothetical protein
LLLTSKPFLDSLDYKTEKLGGTGCGYGASISHSHTWMSNRMLQLIFARHFHHTITTEANAMPIIVVGLLRPLHRSFYLHHRVYETLVARHLFEQLFVVVQSILPMLELPKNKNTTYELGCQD